MLSPARLRLVDPASLEHVWRVQDLAAQQAVIASGHEPLDRQLPGGGWPLGSMIEVLQQRPGQHAWRLLLPALAKAIETSTGPVVLVGSPYLPFGPSLQSQGLPGNRLLCVNADKSASRLWACEQALRCAEVSAVVAWLPQARPAELRRLQMAAHEQQRLLFVFREARSQNDASPARLRLLVDGCDAMNVRIVKRRGPPLETVVSLPAHPRKLAALLKSRRLRSPLLPAPLSAPSSLLARMPSPQLQGQQGQQEKIHVLDRSAAHP
ncbi:MAG: translesion DNA synthesis-associated protein ImuA [Pseudomonadota bacterium]